jgi:dihydroorotate dehydrogenase (NAD+) catalytic subunit
VQLPRYDRSQTYRWNYDHAPVELPVVDVPPVAGTWTFCGRPVRSPLGIAAGPLLNGRWLLYYAALGFDVLTYKTTRSRARECYPLPNLQPVACGPMTGPAHGMPAADEMLGSWAVSFGMPSKAPEDWRADVAWTRSQLPSEKLLSVSVVATPEPEWSLDDLADDFARCARWAIESGADVVETNFSCPNVSTRDGQLYQQPRAAGIVAQRVREAIGSAPYLIKIGFVREAELAAEIVDAVGPFADGLSMTNCISATVHDSRGEPLFDNQPRGIGGDAIRSASVAQVALFAKLVRERAANLRLIGVGGISRARHVREYLAAGAEAVHLASAIMVDPEVGLRIRQELAG